MIIIFDIILLDYNMLPISDSFTKDQKSIKNHAVRSLSIKVKSNRTEYITTLDILFALFTIVLFASCMSLRVCNFPRILSVSLSGTIILAALSPSLPPCMLSLHHTRVFGQPTPRRVWHSTPHCHTSHQTWRPRFHACAVVCVRASSEFLP